MKSFFAILILGFSHFGFASDSCFGEKLIKELVKASKDLDNCFASDEGYIDCGFNEKTIAQQKVINSRRLAPFNRLSGDGFMNAATGTVTATFKKYDGRNSEQTLGASAQKISSCHIITSAHLLFKDGKFPVDSTNFALKFHSGQTCDNSIPFENSVSAKLVFKMMKMNDDFICDRFDKNRSCTHRKISGNSDLVIIKLDKYTEGDKNHFTLNTNGPKALSSGQRVNCWGYPGPNPHLKMPEAQSNKFLWYQKDAQIFGDNDGQSNNGILTNAIVYPGMSGGGCSVSSNPRELIGVFSNDNSAGGQSAIDLNSDDSLDQGANYLSPFQKLAERYSLENNGKRIEDLESECRSSQIKNN